MTTPAGRSSRFDRLLGEGAPSSTVRELCHGAVAHLAMSGAGLTLVAKAGERSTVFATDHVSSQLEALQIGLGEGPCVDAWDSRLPVLEPDLARSLRRWPAFSEQAHAAGAGAVLAVPLSAGGTWLGVLDVYREAAGGMDRDDLRDASRLGDAMAQALLAAEAAAATGTVPGAYTLPHSAEVYQAVGMVVARLGVAPAEAMARLQAHAYAAEQSLGVVARDVVDRKLRLERDH